MFHNMSLQKQYFFVLSFLFFTCFSVAQLPPKRPQLSTSDSTKFFSFIPYQISITDSIVNYGKLFLNTPYHHGSSNGSSFDCSGFTSFVYEKFGYNLNHSSSGQAEEVSTVSSKNLKTGDLVFFSGRRHGKRVGHVGIVVTANENGKFNFIHASTQNGVIISNSDEPYYLKRFIKAGRVIFDNRMIAISPNTKMPKISSNDSISTKYQGPFLNSTQQTKKTIAAKFYRVKKGETLSSIAQKFGLTLAELKQKNNIRNSKINPKQRLKIKDSETVLLAQTIEQPIETEQKLSENKIATPIETKKTELLATTTQPKMLHTVQKGETLFSISNLYSISVEELKKINNLITNKIRFGQKLKLNQKTESTALASIPQKIEKTSEQKPEIPEQKLIHKVLKGESLIGIAKENNISVEDLKKINHLASTKIRFGQELKLTETIQSQKEVSVKRENSPTISHHKVQSGETFYSIAKRYDCKVSDLKKWNKKSANKIKVGEKLIIHTNTN